jgi:alkaline phosphatase
MLLGVGWRVSAVLLALFVVLLAGSSGIETGNAESSGGEAKNVIIFVGDGMGISQRDLIRLATVGLEGELGMDDLPYEGRSHTNSANPNTFVTDSAAGGTALATGVKTYNGAIGVDTNEEPVETVLEQAKQAGKATGLVTDSQVTDATPTSFGAHVPDRDDQSEIARQYVEESQPDVILGGGEDHWYPEDDSGTYPDEPEEDPEERSRGTEGNLVERPRRRATSISPTPKGSAPRRARRYLGSSPTRRCSSKNRRGRETPTNPRSRSPR